MAEAVTDIDAQIAADLAELYDKPLDCVMYMFDWDNDPSIQLVELEEPYKSRFDCKYGPDVWACEFLDELGVQIRDRAFDGVNAVEAIQEAVSSGHGIGKSAISAWLILIIMGTRPYSKGVVTSNTSDQLRTKTWGELAKWKKRCLFGHWFEYNNSKGNMNIYHPQHKDEWRVDAITCREENSEAFAGLHAANSTPWYLFDEASAVPDKIWEVAEGGKTDGEPMHFVFGNPTRNTGRFRDCFAGGRFSHRWNSRKIDSRKVQVTNKTLLTEWVDDYGEDSDFVRVRVRGEFPRAAVTQFIPGDIVLEAMERVLEPREFAAAPKLIGVDVARFGDDKTVITIRQGRRLESITSYMGIDTTAVTAHVVDAYHNCNPRPMAICVDGTGVGAGVVDQLKKMGLPVIDVVVANTSTKPFEYKDIRTQLWGEMAKWLTQESPDIPKDDDMRLHLIGPEYAYTAKLQMVMESKKDMKKRLGFSPDIGDSMALTFFPIQPHMVVQRDPMARRNRAIKRIATKAWT